MSLHGNQTSDAKGAEGGTNQQHRCGICIISCRRFLRTHSRAFFAPFFNRSAEESAEDMYSDEFDEELSYLAKQVSISGAGSPAQAMPYCY